MTVPQPLQRNATLLEGALRTLFAEQPFPLYNLMEYQLGWRDETGTTLDVPIWQPRLHPGLCLLACQALGGNPEKAIPVAAAVELVYQFTQVHADIQDGRHIRYNRPTVCRLWGSSQAINTGDGLHAMGTLLQMRLRGRDVAADDTLRSVHILDTACLRMCEGLYQDLRYRECKEITPDDYLKMAREKTGALMGCALELGAMAATAPTAVSQAFKRFGEDMGIAFQIQEDIQLLWGEPLSGVAAGVDVLNTKKVFPIVQAMDKAPLGQKRDLEGLLVERVLEPSDLERLKDLLDAMGARVNAQQEAQRIYDEAVGHLAEAELPSSSQEELREVARWLALREGTL